MPNLTISDLFAKIGQLTMENEVLRFENETLAKAITSLNGEPTPADDADGVVEDPDKE